MVKISISKKQKEVGIGILVTSIFLVFLLILNRLPNKIMYPIFIIVIIIASLIFLPFLIAIIYITIHVSKKRKECSEQILHEWNTFWKKYKINEENMDFIDLSRYIFHIQKFSKLKRIYQSNIKPKKIDIVKLFFLKRENDFPIILKNWNIVSYSFIVNLTKKIKMDQQIYEIIKPTLDDSRKSIFFFGYSLMSLIFIINNHNLSMLLFFVYFLIEGINRFRNINNEVDIKNSLHYALNLTKNTKTIKWLILISIIFNFIIYFLLKLQLLVFLTNMSFALIMPILVIKSDLYLTNYRSSKIYILNLLGQLSLELNDPDIVKPIVPIYLKEIIEKWKQNYKNSNIIIENWKKIQKDTIAKFLLHFNEFRVSFEKLTGFNNDNSEHENSNLKNESKTFNLANLDIDTSNKFTKILMDINITDPSFNYTLSTKEKFKKFIHIIIKNPIFITILGFLSSLLIKLLI